MVKLAMADKHSSSMTRCYSWAQASINSSCLTRSLQLSFSHRILTQTASDPEEEREGRDGTLFIAIFNKLVFYQT